MSKNLVAYFSASGVTKQLAQNLAEAANADLYEIKPKILYTDDDLNWVDENARSTIEMKDHSSRPEMVEDNFSIKGYDTVFIGFPIWWYIAPTIVNTFLERHDFSNKKIVLFATSGGSGFGRTVENIKPSVADSCEIIQGRILNNILDVDILKRWIDSLGL